VYDTRTGAPPALFGFPTDRPPDMKAPVEIPKLLSWLAFSDVNAPVKGIKDFPPSERPPLWMTFVSFHNMVILGCYFIILMTIAVGALRRGTLWTNRWLLQALIYSTPLPLIACQFGWVAAEVGRQPWIVYHVLRTSDAVSPVVTAEEILASLGLFIAVYLLLAAAYLFLVVREVRHQVN